MKKKLLSFILLFVMMLSLVACGNTDDVSQNPTETKQGTESNVNETTENSETTEIVDETTEIETTQQEETQTPADSEVPNEPESEEVNEPEKPTYTYTDLDKTMYAKSSVNVRSLPTSDGEKLGGLSTGQEIHVTGQCNETSWYRIDYNGSTAYVSNSYLVNEKPAKPKPEPEPEKPTQPSEPVDPRYVEGLPFVPYQVYDEGDIVYYWYATGDYGQANVDAKKAAYAEAEKIMNERYGFFWEFNTDFEGYFHEHSGGNATNSAGKRGIIYKKFALYDANKY